MNVPCGSYSNIGRCLSRSVPVAGRQGEATTPIVYDCRIEHPLGLTIQWVFDGDEIAQFVREPSDVVKRILNRERLALAIDRKRRDIAQGVGDCREIPRAS